MYHKEKCDGVKENKQLENNGKHFKFSLYSLGIEASLNNFQYSHHGKMYLCRMSDLELSRKYKV